MSCSRAFAVLEAFLLDPQSRLLLDEGRFAGLRARDPSLFAALQRLAPPEREVIVQYLRSNVALSAFEKAA